MTGPLLGMKIVTVCVLVVKLQMAIVAGNLQHSIKPPKPVNKVLLEYQEQTTSLTTPPTLG